MQMAEPFPAFKPTVDLQNPLQMAAGYQGLANAAQQNKLMQLQGQGEQQRQALVATNAVQEQLAALAANPNTSPEDIIQRAKVLEVTGVAPKGFTDTITAHVPTDPTQVPAYLKQQLVNVEASKGRLVQALYGSPQLFNNGAQQQVANVNPIPGLPGSGVQPLQGGLFTNQLSPEAATAPTTLGVTPQGAPRVGTRQQFIEATQGGAPSPLGTGRPIPAALRGPGAAPAQPGIVTGLGPAAEAAQTQAGGQSAKAFQDIADQGVQAKSQVGMLGNMLGDSTLMNSGQLKLNDAKAAIMKYAPAIAQSFGVSPDQVAATESLDKLAAQIANAQGAGSDARLAVATTGNPSGHLSPSGLDQMLRQLQGNADYNQARAQLASKYPNQADRPGFEQSPEMKSLDPRAFQFARLTPAQKQTYAKSLSAADLSTVKNAYNKAVDAGLIGGN